MRTLHPNSSRVAGQLATPNSARRLGRLPLWIPLAILIGLVVFAVRSIQADMRGSGFAEVDTGSLHAAFDAPWIDPRWQVELASRVGRRPSFAPDEGRTVESILEEVRSLSFVADVADARVRWPDAVEFWVQLRRPIACVQVGRKFLTVDPDGTLLSGTWTAPPYVSSGFLPVLGPNDGAFDDWEPGMQLVEQRHLDALSIADSMWTQLEPAAREALGRSLIDATRAAAAGPDEPGAEILLEGPRTIWFGRAPRDTTQGELPSRAKWQHLALAMDVTEQQQREWNLIDLRWDEPELSFVDHESAAAEPAASE